METPKKIISIFIMITAILFSICPQAFAEEQTSGNGEEFFEMSIEDLMNVEVSVASRKIVTRNEAPGIVTVITRDEIQKSGARDLIDILRLVPGVDITYDTFGAYGISIRGIWANEGKVLVLIDGLEMNDSQYGTFQFGHHIPVDLIERIEIMRGPGSVMYGEHAELGVISITTIEPQTESERFVSSTYSRTSKNLDRYSFTGYYGMKKDDFSFSISANDGRGNFSDRVSPKYDLDWLNSVDLSKENNSKVTDTFINMSLKKGNFSARVIYDRYNLNSPFPADGVGEMYVMKFNSEILETKYRLPISDDLSMTSKFVYTRHDSWNFERTGAGYGPEKVITDKYKGENYFSYDLDGGHNIVFGLSYEKIDGRDETKGGYFLGSDKVTYYNAAVYGEGFFKTPYGNLTIGGRQVKNNHSGDNFVPRAVLTKQLGDYHIKAIYSQAYRNPDMMNIALQNAIEPEHTTTFEFELGKQVSDNWLVAANVFDVEVDNPIIWSLDQVGAYRNYEKTATRGVEVSSIYKKGTSTLNISYSYYTPRENKVDPIKPTGHEHDGNLAIPNHKFTLLASFSPHKNMFITPSFTYHGSKYGVTDIGSEYIIEKSDPTIVANLSLLFKDMFNKKGMDLSFTIHNIFDERIEYFQPVRDWYGMIPGPSRAFTMNLRYKF